VHKHKKHATPGKWHELLVVAKRVEMDKGNDGEEDGETVGNGDTDQEHVDG